MCTQVTENEFELLEDFDELDYDVPETPPK